MTASVLPYNATPFERTLEGAMGRIGDVSVPLRDLWNPETCPIAALPWLAWSLSIDTWNPAWPESVKRARVANAIAIQRKKGTSKSVRDVVAAYGGAIAIREWWETSPRGTPHTFALTIFGGQASLVDDVVADVTRVKPLRSHFTFTQALTAAGSVGMAAGARPVTYARLNGLPTPS